MTLFSKYHHVLIAVVIIIVASLSLVIMQNLTREKIETQNDIETVELLQSIFSEADSYVLKSDSGSDIYIVYDKSVNKIGYSFYAKGIGYKDWFNVLVGLENTTTIKGIDIISHNEHQGSGYTEGNKVDFSEFSLQFIDLNIEDCVLSKDGGVIDAVTMATLGSRAIVDTIKEEALEKSAIIIKEGY
jgi:Na+-translocating ferredoxin:NAD+ oxidoreductase RnfG subunit